MNHVYFLARKDGAGGDRFRCYNALELIGESEVTRRGRVRVIRIRAGETDMDCLVDMDQTVFPGAEYSVLFSDGGEPAKIVYLERNRHLLIWGRYRIEVRIRGFRYKFFLEKQHFATMIPVEPTDPVGALVNERWTPRYTMMSRVKLPEILAALMLHFPMLEIGI